MISFSNAMTLADNTVSDQDKAVKRMEAREDMLRVLLLFFENDFSDLTKSFFFRLK